MASDTERAARVVHAENLFEAWLELRPLYAKRCDPHTLELLRHAFYLGAVACFSILVHGRGPDGEPSARIDAMNEELKAFQYDIRRVRAGGS